MSLTDKWVSHEAETVRSSNPSPLRLFKLQNCANNKFLILFALCVCLSLLHALILSFPIICNFYHSFIMPFHANTFLLSLSDAFLYHFFFKEIYIKYIVFVVAYCEWMYLFGVLFALSLLFHFSSSLPWIEIVCCCSTEDCFLTNLNSCVF